MKVVRFKMGAYVDFCATHETGVLRCPSGLLQDG